MRNVAMNSAAKLIQPALLRRSAALSDAKDAREGVSTGSPGGNAAGRIVSTRAGFSTTPKAMS